MIRRRTAALLLYTLLLPLATVRGAAQSDANQREGPQRYALLIAGLGGEEMYTRAIGTYLRDTRESFVQRFGMPETHISVLAEQALVGEAFVDKVSTAENIRAAFAELSAKISEEDELYVFLFGHGSFDGTEARLNIPRADLSDRDFASLLGTVEAGRLIFVNTASASGPFVKALAGDGRVIIAATRAGSQHNATQFPRYLVQALKGDEADLDKDGALSVGEVFRYVATETGRFFDSDGRLATEFALLDDNGDGIGHELEDLQSGGDGALADVTYFSRGSGEWAEQVLSNPAIAPYMLERSDIEFEIASLKSRKGELDEEHYYRNLERLFVQLAKLNDKIEILSGS